MLLARLDGQTSPTKSVWSPASCSAVSRHSSQPIAPTSSGARGAPRLAMPCQSAIGGTPRAKCCASRLALRQQAETRSRRRGAAARASPPDGRSRHRREAVRARARPASRPSGRASRPRRRRSARRRRAGSGASPSGAPRRLAHRADHRRGGRSRPVATALQAVARCLALKWSDLVTSIRPTRHRRPPRAAAAGYSGQLPLSASSPTLRRRARRGPRFRTRPRERVAHPRQGPPRRAAAPRGAATSCPLRPGPSRSCGDA